MFRRGLKTHITATLVLLMLGAVLLGNVVAVIFWQRAMVRMELEHVEAILDTTLALESGGADTISEINLAALCRLIGKRCVGVLPYDVNGLGGGEHGELSGAITSSAKSAAYTQKRIITLTGSIWSGFLLHKRYMLVAEPVRSDGGGIGSVVLMVELGSIYENIRQDQKIIFVYLLVNVLLLTVVGFFRMANLVVRPIEQMIDITDNYQVADNLFFSTVREYGEFGRLNQALNNMLDRIESDKNILRETIQSLEDSNQELIKAHDEVVRAEKLASVGRLSAGFAHEIGNPITIVRGYIELLQGSDLSDEQKMQYGVKAFEELERINRMIRQLLDYARESTLELKPVLIDEELLESILDIVHLEQERAHVRIQTKFDSGLVFVGSKEALRQVLLNCILNSIDAIQGHDMKVNQGIIEIAGSLRKENEQADIYLEIKDNGVGISEDKLESVFDPFYSTKPTGKGTGLGLYVSHAIIEALGGRIWMESNDQGGATVCITLPFCENKVVEDKDEAVDR